MRTDRLLCLPVSILQRRHEGLFLEVYESEYKKSSYNKESHSTMAQTKQ